MVRGRQEGVVGPADGGVGERGRDGGGGGGEGDGGHGEGGPDVGVHVGAEGGVDEALDEPAEEFVGGAVGPFFAGLGEEGVEFGFLGLLEGVGGGRGERVNAPM